MSKPIYLDQDLCTKLQSKGLECGSGMWWIHVDSPALPAKYVGQSLAIDYVLVQKNEVIAFNGSEPGTEDDSPAYELHIDILGSRENLVKIVTDYYQIKEFSHGLLSLIHDGFPDQAINLIKEATKDV